MVIFMRFLILSCNTGEGHNSAAKAIKEYFEMNGSGCEIVDSLSFLSPEASKIISKGHVLVYRNLPKLFGAAYRFEENHRAKEGEESLIYEILTNGCRKLNKYLQRESFDGVICVHIFSAMMMTHLRKSKKTYLPLYFVATDYTCSPGTNELICDKYFIPHLDLTDEFVKNGIEKEKIVPSGIPIRQEFYRRISKQDAKRELGIDENERVVLLTCGSMGCGPIKELTSELPKVLPSGVRLVVICGSNKRLYTRIYKEGVPKNTTVLGYTNRMALYMDSADIILTKPGGLSSTEGASKHRPLVFIDAVPGCETRNLDFFIEKGFALSSSKTDELIDIIVNCMLVPADLEAVSNNISKSFTTNHAKTIYDEITSFSART
ncbi:MAG: hypothetical protein MJ090_02715 [Clostridia bacterium]|nr:hypothetical protein [Clostridia bacterium]